MKNLLIALAAVFTLMPAMSRAQDRVVIDTTYIGGSFSSMYDYPKDQTIRTGKQYDGDGVGLSADVRIVDGVTVGYRYERGSLRNAQYVDETTAPNGKHNTYLEPDTYHTGSVTQYQEFYGSFALPRTHGHSLIVGVTKSSLERMWASRTLTGTMKDSYLGLVVGGQGRQKVRRVTFDYAGRLYPHTARTATGNYPSSDLESIGFELEGTATWSVAKHIGLTGGYQFRRLGTDVMLDGADGRPWPIHENQDSKSLLVGTRISF